MLLNAVIILVPITIGIWFIAQIWNVKLGPSGSINSQKNAPERTAGSSIQMDRKKEQAPIQGTGPSPIGYATVVGNWYDGGPGCASLDRTTDSATFVFRGWYCEADKAVAKPIKMTFDVKLNALVEPKTKLTLRRMSNNHIMVSIPKASLSEYGDLLYLAETERQYARQK